MKLHPLRLGTVDQAGLPIAGYLVRLGDGRNVLIDTGADPAAPPPGPAVHLDRPFRVEESEHVVAQLAGLGLTPADIDVVVCTHLHPDHAGNHDAFGDAEFVVQDAELRAAREGAQPGYAMARRHWDAPGLRYRTVEGDTELVPGVELVSSPGHSAGHQSVLVRLPSTGPVLIAADAIPFASDADPDTRSISPFDFDERATRASTRRLVELAERESVAFTVYGHDREQWSTLRVGAGHHYD